MPTAITQANIQTAVNAWCLNPTTATTTYGHISTWNTVNVTSMTNLFRDKTTFNDDISAWNVSNVTNMDFAFFNALVFDQPIGSWNVGAVTSFNYTFCGAKIFNRDLNGWNVSNATVMTAMFYLATKFNGNVSNWNVSKATATDLMFANCPAFNQNIGGWDVRKVTAMTSMFQNNSAFLQDLSLWEVPLISALPTSFDNLSSMTTNPKFYPHWGKFRLTPVGSRYTSVFRNSPYVDAGVSEVYSTITTTSNVNTAVAGSYTVEYTATAAVTGKTAPSYQIRYVTVIDSTPTSVTFPTSTTSVNRGNVVSLVANMLSGTWKYSVDNGSTWVLFSTTVPTSSSFVVADGTYAIGAIQVRCTDSTGNNTVPVTNSLAITIDLVGPVGHTASIPTSTSPTYRENVVAVTLPSTAVSWKYSVNSGSSWTTNPTSSLSFALAEGTYAANAIKVVCTSAAGNDSAVISNLAVVIIDFTGPYGLAVSFPPSTSFLSKTQTVTITNLPSDSVSWKYSVNGGTAWTIQDISSSSFILAEATYEANAIQVLCSDSAGNTSAIISNSAVIIIDLTGPYGFVVTFPTTTSSATVLPADVGTVYITNLPVDAVSLKYSVNNGGVWMNLTRTGSSSSFILVEAVYTVDAIQVVCADSAGNNSVTIKNTEIITINYQSVLTPVIPTAATVNGKVELDSISTLDLTNALVIGTSVAQNRSFTSSMIKSLLSANTAQNQLVLKRTNILPGFSVSLPSEVYLFNASAKITNSRKMNFTKDDLLSRNFYIVLDSGDAMSMATINDTVSISKLNDIFTITTGAGVTAFRTTGEIYSYDGLRITLGSIYGSLMPPSVNFVLTALSNVISLATSAVIPDVSFSLTSDATITLANGITVDQAQNTFYFRTDDPITTDASFVYYYVDTAKWPNKAVVLSPKNGIVTSNAYVASDAVGKDFLRDLARQLFGTYLGADLFTNEDSVITDINSKCDTVGTNLISLLSSIDKTSGSLSGLQTDLSGNKYFGDNSSTSNISRELFNQLMTNAVSRFSDIKSNYKMNAAEDGTYRMPILAGDSITFKMTISPASGQVAAVPTGPTSLLNRTYTVILNVV